MMFTKYTIRIRGAKDVKPDFFVGVKWVVTHDSGIMTCENTMTALILLMAW